GEAPMRYRLVVLEPGGSMSANDLVKNFLGRPQNMTAFQHWMGEEFEAASTAEKAADNDKRENNQLEEQPARKTGADFGQVIKAKSLRCARRLPLSRRTAYCSRMCP